MELTITPDFQWDEKIHGVSEVNTALLYIHTWLALQLCITYYSASVLFVFTVVCVKQSSHTI